VAAIAAKTDRAADASEPLGMEGEAAALYFRALPHLFTDSVAALPAFNFERRNRRPPGRSGQRLPLAVPRAADPRLRRRGHHRRPRSLEGPASCGAARPPGAGLSRAIRLTLVQEATAETALDVLIAGDDKPDWDDAPAWEDDDRAANDNVRAPADPCGRNHPSAHRNHIRDRVCEVINAEVGDVYKAHEGLDDLHERLAEGDGWPPGYGKKDRARWRR